MDPLTFVPSASGLRGEVLGLQSQLTLGLQSLHFSVSRPSELLNLQSLWTFRASGPSEILVFRISSDLNPYQILTIFRSFEAYSTVQIEHSECESVA